MLFFQNKTALFLADGQKYLHNKLYEIHLVLAISFTCVYNAYKFLENWISNK